MSDEFASSAPWPPPPSPDAQAAALYTPRRGSISDAASVEPADEDQLARMRDAIQEGEDNETPPPLYNGAPIVYLNEGDDGFDEIRAAIDLVDESGSPDAEPSEDDEPPEDDPPPSAPDSAVPWWLEEGKEDDEDKLAA